MKKLLYNLGLMMSLLNADTMWERSLKTQMEHTCRTILTATNPQLNGLLPSADIKSGILRNKNVLYTIIAMNGNIQFNCIGRPYGRYSIKLEAVEFANGKKQISALKFDKLHN